MAFVVIEHTHAFLESGPNPSNVCGHPGILIYIIRLLYIDVRLYLT